MSLTLQTLMPAVITPTSQTIVTDIDGDGVNELIILNNDVKHFSVVHQFKFTDFTFDNGLPIFSPGNSSPIWTSDSNEHWWALWTAQDGSVPPAAGTDGWDLGAADVIMAADLNGDNVDELFIYNLTTLWWGVLKWNSDTNQLEMLYKVDEATPLTVNGLPGWTAALEDQYFIIPNLSAIMPGVQKSADGILAYNPLSLNVGIISYSPPPGSTSPSEFIQWWSTANSLSGWNLSANNPPNNVFFPGNFADSVEPSIMVFDPTDNYVSLLTWNGKELTSSPGQTTAGNWGFDVADQIQCADVDGDELTELLIYNQNHHSLGVVKWINGQFGSLAVTEQPIGTAPNDWTIARNQFYYPVNGTGNNPGPIYAFAPSSSTVALLNCQGNAFVWKWSNTSLLPNNGWPVTSADRFYAVQPSNLVTPTFFTLSNQGPTAAPVPMLGAVSWNTTTLQLQIDSSSNIPVLGWSPSFLASAPKTEFAPFTEGDQPAIFTYISSVFPVPDQKNPNPPTDVRKKYKVSSDQGFFLDYGNDLKKVSSPQKIPTDWIPQPPPNTWGETDWANVVNTISAECTQVFGAYGVYGPVSQLGTAFNAFETNDFGIAKANVQTAANNTSTSAAATYWAGQLFVALMWGLAGSGGLFLKDEAAAAFSVFFSMAASAAGSVAGYNPTQSRSVELQEIQNDITGMYVSAIDKQSTDRHTILKDPVKLNIFYGLSQGPWQVTQFFSKSVQNELSGTDRLGLYQQMMPLYFSIVMVTPLTIFHPPAQPPPVLFELGVNKYSLLANEYVTVAQYTSTSPGLFSDLFTIIGVSPQDFFLGNGGWAFMPRQTL